MNAQIDPLCRRDINDRALAMSSGEEMPHFIERRDRRGKANSLHRDGTALDLKCVEPLDAKSEVRAALVVCEGVDFVDDQPAHIAEERQPFFLAKKNAKAFGCREENVWRFGKLSLSLPGGGVAGAQLDADR